MKRKLNHFAITKTSATCLSQSKAGSLLIVQDGTFVQFFTMCSQTDKYIHFVETVLFHGEKCN